MKNTASSGTACKADPELGGMGGVETPARTDLIQTTSLVPYFLLVYCFHPHFSYGRLFWQNLDPEALVWGTLWMTEIHV
jgi:hypothetical protein